MPRYADVPMQKLAIRRPAILAELAAALKSAREELEHGWADSIESLMIDLLQDSGELRRFPDAGANDLTAAAGIIAEARMMPVSTRARIIEYAAILREAGR